MTSSLPFAPACENNKAPILSVLAKAFAHCSHILEIGSGTGQHAAYFSAMMPWLEWHPSDREGNLSLIRQWHAHAALHNFHAPIALDVTTEKWPTPHSFDGVFSANTCHIMHWDAVQLFIKGTSQSLKDHGIFCLYGPFNYQNQFTSDSNAQFDAWLKQRDPHSGIRDQEQIVTLAQSNHLILTDDYAMPANNRLLIFIKQP